MKICFPFWLVLCGMLSSSVLHAVYAEPGGGTGAASGTGKGAVLFNGVTYYVDAMAGSDGSDGRTEQSAWKTIARVNRAVFNPGDAVLFRRGSMWREQLVISSGGSPGFPMTFGAYGKGDRPVINGSDTVEHWILLKDNIWAAPVNSQPEAVYFRGERGMHRLSIADVNVEHSWCWNSRMLFVYSAEPLSDIEIPVRPYCIMNEWKRDANFIVLSNLECRQSGQYGIFNNYGGDDWIIENSVVHHIGGVEYDRAGIMVQGNRTIVRDNTIYQSAANGIDVYSNGTGNPCVGVIIERNLLYDCVHSHIDLQGPENTIVRGNSITMREVSTRSMGIFCGDTGENIITLRPEISSNLIYRFNGNGIQLDGNTRDASVFQNTVFGCSDYCFYVSNGSNPAILRNNIGCAEGSGRIFRVVNTLGKTISHNCLFSSGENPGGAEDTIINVMVNANGDSCDSRFNFCLDPEFIDIAAEDYRVRNTSPCIGSGRDLGTGGIDHDGLSRGNPPDLGAFENTLARPLHKPHVLTDHLPDAAYGEQYASALQVTDADPGDSFIFSIIQGPGWMKINSSGIISGVPAKDDVGANIPVVIRVEDSHGLSDLFSNPITVVRRNRPPVFTTREIPRAVAGKPYTARVAAVDPDTEDTVRLRKLIGPEWLSVSAEGMLTGAPGLNDGDHDTPLSLVAEDPGGLADTLKVALRVLVPPRIRLLSPNGGEAWGGGLAHVLFWETTSVDSIRVDFSPDSGKSWLPVAERVAAADSSLTWTVPGAASNRCLVRITALEYSEVADQSDGKFSIFVPGRADFALDSDLAAPGYQGMDQVMGLREGNLAGFALYAREWKNEKAVVVRMEWDSARAKFYSGGSGPHITGEKLQVNGRTIFPQPERNILGDQTSYAISRNVPGGMTIILNRPERTPSPYGQGLIYLALFKILPPFGTINHFDVRISVDYVGSDGAEFALGSRLFTVLAMMQPPSGIWVTPILNAPGLHRVTWKESPSEREGTVKWYRIYRSRNPEFTEPAPRSRFTSRDSLFAWEALQTVLMDSVSAGVTEYMDSAPLNEGPYYYWLQAAGDGTESGRARSEMPGAVEEPSPAPLLGNARPNPFNPRVSIDFTLPRDTPVSLVVYNALGMKIAVLAEGRKKAGRYSVSWDAGDRPSGVYFYTLRAGGIRETKKMLLVR